MDIPSPHWSDRYCGGAWIVSSYREAAAALRDRRLTTARAGAWVNVSGPGARGEFRALKAILARTMLFTDGARHRRLRSAAAPAFGPAALGALAPAVRAAVDELVDGVSAEAGVVDFIARFARPLPVRVIAAMLGIPRADCAALVDWSDDVAAFIGEPTPTLESARRAQAGAEGIVAYFRGRLEWAPQDGGLAGLLSDAARRGVMTQMDLLAQCGMFLFAGHETTRNLLGNALLLFLQHPDAWTRLREGRAALRPALREVLRMDSPVQYTGRRALHDLDIGGQRVRRGDLVIVDVAGANRDPSVFGEPDAFRIDRDDAPPLTFGWGPHLCIGAELSYLEAQTAFEVLLRRLPHLRLAGTPLRQDNPVYRGLDSLPVAVGGAFEAPPGADLRAA